MTILGKVIGGPSPTSVNVQGTELILDADAFIVIDGTTTKQIPASDIVTYAGTTADANAIVFAIAL